MDFTIKKYKQLLLALQKGGYKFVSFKDYIASHENAFIPAVVREDSQMYKKGGGYGADREALPNETLSGAPKKRLILRHDVDRLPGNSLKLARLEHDLGITGAYYFRIVPESYDLSMMHAIAGLGHEIGYHYEDVDLASKAASSRDNEIVESRNNGKTGSPRSASGDSSVPTSRHSNIPPEALIDLAYESFRHNLEILRKDFDVTTACMHGSPRSKYDNRIIWKKYDYRKVGIVGEPYFDIDYDRVAYFTDTGRRWNGEKVSVRDKVFSSYHFNFKTTEQLIDNINSLPDEVMLTIHPQRWADERVAWARELVWQNVKNTAKRILVAKSRE